MIAHLNNGKMEEKANINSPYTAKTALGAPKEKTSVPFALKIDKSVSTSTANPIKNVEIFSLTPTPLIPKKTVAEANT